MHDSDFISKLNLKNVQTMEGIIDSLLVINDCVYAVIKKNYNSIMHNGIVVDSGQGLFNCGDGTDPEDRTLPELLIRTDIQAFNTILDRYIGKSCSVTVKNDIPIYASLNMGDAYTTTFDMSAIRNLRASLGNTDAIFSDKNRDDLKSIGLTDTNVEDLKATLYKKDYSNKLLTIEGEGTWFRDTSNPSSNEVVLKNNTIWTGLNESTMNDKKYHIPTVVFSGK